MRAWPAVVLIVLTPSLLHAEAPGADEWKYDVVHRKKGVPLRGLVVEQTPVHVHIKCISRRPGSPTVVFTEFIPRAEVESVVLLGAEDRKLLEQRLDSLRREREALAAQLKALEPGSKEPRPADMVDLRPATWPLDEKAEAFGYESAHFTLVSNARSEVVQLAAIHLEQIYAAYARTLPPRTTGGKPTTILLTRSLADYQAFARERGLNLFNPGYYDPARNEVVVGSDLERMSDELEKVRRHHAELKAGIKERRAELNKVYRNKVPEALLAPLAAAEKRIALSESRNEQVFTRVRQRLFNRLYHEAFHAYLGTFVYPAREGSMPHWFNEGLAQVFETAFIEAGELRVGHADRDRVASLRHALAKDQLLPLAELLRSEPKQFVVAHASDQQVSDRHYLASWALAFYLTFDRKLLGTPALDRYVKDLKRGTDPVEAFRDLVGQPLPAFEKEYRLYLQSLRPPGPADR